MIKLKKVYLEISNLCNLHCSFCPGTKRKNHILTEQEFLILIDRLRPYTDYLYFHVMGEPLLHPGLKTFLELAGAKGFKVILTTNGTLLENCREMLLSSHALHKVNISLQALEGNNSEDNHFFDSYLNDCIRFGKEAEGKKIVVYRLWNEGGAEKLNASILERLHEAFPSEWIEGRKGLTLGNRIFLEHGEKFDWPDLTANEYSGRFFCYGLRDQLGVLCDGTVVPCCLDHEGDIALGNLFEQELPAILASERAQKLLSSFSDGKASEELCRRCGYAQRFTR